MGNSSTTSDTSVAESHFGRNESLRPEAEHGFFWPFDSSSAMVTDMVTECHVQTGKTAWLGLKIFVLVTASPANAGLMWMLLSRARTMTPSELLGLNVSAVDVLYCLCLPLDIYTTLHESSETVHSVREALFSLCIFGCPLLLSFMCLERYVAVARPVAYIRLGRREYRVALCAGAWTLTLTVALLEYFVNMLTMALCLSITISVLFLVMLLCLLGIVRVLRRDGPGEGSGSSAPLKRRALKNILAVMVPSVVAYSPLLALVPYMLVIVSRNSEHVDPAQCHILQLLLLFPNFGLFIGPMFYLSRVRQVTCWRKDKQNPTSKTQEV